MHFKKEKQTGFCSDQTGRKHLKVLPNVLVNLPSRNNTYNPKFARLSGILPLLMTSLPGPSP